MKIISDIHYLDENEVLNTLQGLPIGEPLSFLEVYIMSLNCPYCLSDQVIQVVNHQVSGSNSTGLAASTSFATIGASISKGLPLPVSPLLGGLAGAVIGGLFSSMFDEPKKPITMTYYHCNHCQQNFR